MTAKSSVRLRMAVVRGALVGIWLRRVCLPALLWLPVLCVPTPLGSLSIRFVYIFFFM